MAKETEDELGELYGWDSTIEDVFALSENDPKRDEDDAHDAYEEIIQVASRPDDGSDQVLSLAAQLLTKHFFKFPHVHMNVIDAMLALCSAERPQAVRIHTIRSLLRIVKTSPSERELLASACSDRVQDVIAKLVAKETSVVITRHMTQLGKALKERREVVARATAAAAQAAQAAQEAAAAAAAAEENKLATKTSVKLTKSEKQLKRREDKQKEHELKKQKEREQRDAEHEQKEKERELKKKALVPTSTFTSALRAVQNEVAPREPPADAERSRYRCAQSEDYDEQDNAKASPDARRSVVEITKPSRSDERRNKEESGATGRDGDGKRSRIEELLARPADLPRRSSDASNFGPQTCPPGPYIFIGNLPPDLRNSDIVAYLSKVDPSLRFQNVQVKYPGNGTSGYAFVSLRTTQLARETIRFVSRVEFRGHLMKPNFARGPPCQTLAFVERNGKGRTMEDDNAVRDFDFTKCNRTVWDRLCEELRTFGKMDVVETGKVRFSSVESAKQVIQRHHLTIQGYEIIPIYDPEEQLKNDGTRFRPSPQSQQSPVARQSFALKSGRVVGDRDLNREADLPASDPPQVPESRSEKRERKSDERKSRKRSPSPTPKKPERSSNHEHSRSRSASPLLPKSKQHEARARRSRSRSPVANPRKQSAHDRSRSRSISPDASKNQHQARKKSASRSRSPAPAPPARKQKNRARSRSRSISPVPTRKQDSRCRSRSPAAPPVQRKQPVVYENPLEKRSADRSRSRSPVTKERKPAPRRGSSPANQQMGIDSRGAPERAQPRRKSRSRSGERGRHADRDVSTYGPGAHGDSDKQDKRDRNARDEDQPFERSRPHPERRKNGGPRMSRYGPASFETPSDRAPSNNGAREKRPKDRQALKRDNRDGPQLASLGDENQETQRNEPHRRSRSPPRPGGDRARSKSPRSRPGSDGAPRVIAESTSGRGHNSRPLERKNSGGSSSRRGDDRSIAEIAYEEQERLNRQQQQQSRRDSRPAGPLSKYGDGGRAEHFPTPQPPAGRDGGRPRGGSFQKPHSRSRSPPRRPSAQQLSRQGDVGRDNAHSSPQVPPNARVVSRGDNGKGSDQQRRGNDTRSSPLLELPKRVSSMRDSPLLDRPTRRDSMRDSPLLDHVKRGYNVRTSPLLDAPTRDRRDSDAGRFERRGRSPPPSPLTGASDRRAPPPPPLVVERRRSRSNTRGRADERERDRGRDRNAVEQSYRSETRRSEKEVRVSNDQNNRNRANHQGNDRSNKGRPQQPGSPVFASPPLGKRLRSLSPSPVRRGNSSSHHGKPNREAERRERSRSPILKRAAARKNDDDAPSFSEKKRRIDVDNERDVLPKPTSSAVFDDMDDMMVDYEEDD